MSAATRTMGAGSTQRLAKQNSPLDDLVSEGLMDASAKVRCRFACRRPFLRSPGCAPSLRQRPGVACRCRDFCEHRRRTSLRRSRLDELGRSGRRASGDLLRENRAAICPAPRSIRLLPPRRRRAAECPEDSPRESLRVRGSVLPRDLRARARGTAQPAWIGPRDLRV